MRPLRPDLHQEEMMHHAFLVVVHCYAGEMVKLPWLMPGWTQHGMPMMFLAPADQPVTMGSFPTFAAGESGWKGINTWWRQLEHWKIALAESGAQWFLLNDADSFCLSADLPDYLFADRNAFYANVLCHEEQHEESDRPNFQPPYFTSRDVLEKLVDAVEDWRAAGLKAKADDIEFGTGAFGFLREEFKDQAAIDGMYTHFIMNELQVPWHSYPDGTTTWPPQYADFFYDRIEAGARFVHPVKSPEQLRQAMYRYRRGKELREDPNIIAMRMPL